MTRDGIHALEIHNLRKRFGGLQAVDGIGFTVRRGEFFGLLGPNGAGKTTTIRMATGIMTPDSGSIIIDGIDAVRNPIGAKSSIGVIPEIGNVYPDLTARENVELVGRYHGMGRESRRSHADELLTDLSLIDRADDKVSTFSKGMRQRVSIAAAMIHDPQLLFLDEPTEGLDVKSRRAIVDLVNSMNANGSAILLTTHNIEEASRLCERVCIINRGKVVAIESPERLRRAAEGMRSVDVLFDRCVDGDPFDGLGEPVGHNDHWRFRTDDPDATISSIMEVRGDADLRILSLRTLEPSLEDVFVRLTEGRT